MENRRETFITQMIKTAGRKPMIAKYVYVEQMQMMAEETVPKLLSSQPSPTDKEMEELISSRMESLESSLCELHGELMSAQKADDKEETEEIQRAIQNVILEMTLPKWGMYIKNLMDETDRRRTPGVLTLLEYGRQYQQMENRLLEQGEEQASAIVREYIMESFR